MDTLLLKALFKETQQDRIDTSTFGLRLRFLGLDPFAAFVSASVRLVDRRFCHATGNRTNEQRERGIFFAGKKISTAGKWSDGLLLPALLGAAGVLLCVMSTALVRAAVGSWYR